MDFGERPSVGSVPSSADRGKDAFVLAVAHDLRASVAALAGSLAVLDALGGDLSSEHAAALLDAMGDAVADAESVINNLFDIERIEHGVGAVVRAPTDLPALVERVVRRSGDPDRIDLEVDDAVVEVDPGLTERILANLVANALEHTGPSARVTVCARDRKDHLLLHIDDTGPGIPSDVRSKVFEPFHGASGNGMGIGLYLVRQFALLHGGDAWIEDVPDGGTSVRVRLPTD